MKVSTGPSGVFGSIVYVPLKYSIVRRLMLWRTSAFCVCRVGSANGLLTTRKTNSSRCVSRSR